MSFNQFTKVMTNKSSDELKVILSEKNNYDEQAVLAAIVELKNRNELSDEFKQLGIELAEKFKQEEKVREFNDKFFSKKMIYGMAGLLSPLIVGPFMAYNIWSLGNKKDIGMVVLLAILYLPMTIIAGYFTPVSLSGVILPLFHLSYVTFFVEWLWKRYLPTYEDYNKQKNEVG